MSMTRRGKEEAVASLSEKLGRAKGALVATFTGLDVEAVNDIRRQFRAVGVDYRVVKNTLMKRVLNGRGIEKLGSLFQGPTAIALKYDEEFARLGKTAKELAKKYEKFQVKGGYIDTDVIAEPRALETMASLPTLDEARSMLLGVLNAPASQLVGVLNAPASQLLGVIEAKRKKDEEGAS